MSANFAPDMALGPIVSRVALFGLGMGVTLSLTTSHFWFLSSGFPGIGIIDAIGPSLITITSSGSVTSSISTVKPGDSLSVATCTEVFCAHAGITTKMAATQRMKR